MFFLDVNFSSCLSFISLPNSRDEEDAAGDEEE
jgi:hypothetical protein